MVEEELYELEKAMKWLGIQIIILFSSMLILKRVEVVFDDRIERLVVIYILLLMLWSSLVLCAFTYFKKSLRKIIKVTINISMIFYTGYLLNSVFKANLKSKVNLNLYVVTIGVSLLILITLIHAMTKYKNDPLGVYEGFNKNIEKVIYLVSGLIAMAGVGNITKSLWWYCLGMLSFYIVSLFYVEKLIQNKKKEEVKEKAEIKLYPSREYQAEILEKYLKEKDVFHSFVLVDGKWGIGKTTFVDLALKKYGMEKRQIKVNAMLFSTKKEMVKVVFDELESYLEKNKICVNGFREVSQYLESIMSEAKGVFGFLKGRSGGYEEKKSIIKRKLKTLNKSNEEPIFIVDNIERIIDGKQIVEIIGFLHELEEVDGIRVIVAVDREKIDLPNQYLDKFFLRKIKLNYPSLFEILQGFKVKDNLLLTLSRLFEYFDDGLKRLEEKREELKNKADIISFGKREVEYIRKFVLNPRNISKVLNEYKKIELQESKKEELDDFAWRMSLYIGIYGRDEVIINDETNLLSKWISVVLDVEKVTENQMLNSIKDGILFGGIKIKNKEEADRLVIRYIRTKNSSIEESKVMIQRAKLNNDINDDEYFTYLKHLNNVLIDLSSEKLFEEIEVYKKFIKMFNDRIKSNKQYLGELVNSFGLIKMDLFVFKVRSESYMIEAIFDNYDAKATGELINNILKVSYLEFEEAFMLISNKKKINRVEMKENIRYSWSNVINIFGNLIFDIPSNKQLDKRMKREIIDEVKKEIKEIDLCLSKMIEFLFDKYEKHFFKDKEIKVKELDIAKLVESCEEAEKLEESIKDIKKEFCKTESDDKAKLYEKIKIIEEDIAKKNETLRQSLIFYIESELDKTEVGINDIISVIKEISPILDKVLLSINWGEQHSDGELDLPSLYTTKILEGWLNWEDISNSDIEEFEKRIGKQKEIVKGILSKAIVEMEDYSGIPARMQMILNVGEYIIKTIEDKGKEEIENYIGEYYKMITEIEKKYPGGEKDKWFEKYKKQYEEIETQMKGKTESIQKK